MQMTSLLENQNNEDGINNESYDFKFQYYDDMVIASYYYQGTIEGEKATPWKAVSIFRYENQDWRSVLEYWTKKM